MSKQTLVVLLGNSNDGNGNLSQIAKSRCDAAIEELRKYESALLLPTGAFGHGFNTTDEAHWKYLKSYLEARSVGQDRILDGTYTANTVEDCLYARKLVIDRDIEFTVVVTSDYHATRVAFILRYVFRGLEYALVRVPNPEREFLTRQEREEIDNEPRNFREFRKDWVSPVLYSKGATFPEAVYEAAGNEHRHYDTVSLAVVSGAILLSGFAFGIAFGSDGGKSSEFARLGEYAALPIAIAFVFLLLDIYERCARTARVARMVMKNIENGYDMRGVSATYDPRSIFSFWLDIKTCVRTAFVLLLVILFAGSAYKISTAFSHQASPPPNVTSSPV